jgi:hypothetical protein
VTFRNGRLTAFLNPPSHACAHNSLMGFGGVLRLAAALVAALGAASLPAAAGGASSQHAAAVGEPMFARSLDSRITVLDERRLAQSALAWRGGPITTSTGEVVNVLVSDTFTPEQAAPETWAEFLVGLVHGPELASLTMHVAPIAEVRRLCGLGALGCYSRNEAVAIGEVLPDGTTAEEVVRHEYGHHIALYRSNAPWRAIDWGPKRWASAANICARVARGEASPGDENENYTQNPGEAWAEVYRLMDERKDGILTGTWQVVAPSFYPDDTALQAAEQDVVSPWTAGQTIVKRKQLTRKGQTWWIPLSTPLDGSLSVRITMPKGGQYELALLGSNRRTVLRRGVWSGQRARTISTNVCGQRAPYVRVTQKGTLGQVTVSVAKP